MIRRALLAALGLVLVGSAAAPALADVVSASAQDSNHYLCLLGTNQTNGVRDGICIWIPS